MDVFSLSRLMGFIVMDRFDQGFTFHHGGFWQYSTMVLIRMLLDVYFISLMYSGNDHVFH